MATHLLFIGTTELMLIAGIALLIFGGKKLPEMMKGLGQGVQNFKKGMNEPIEEDEEDAKVESEQIEESQAER
ncbi:MAG: twin-arginine translocase TatA/TatE family subunit [Aeriscardovia sp.]|nr:twin-arginine translocase TatA/TatE family subunit [Aeriscardovia sp.]